MIPYHSTRKYSVRPYNFRLAPDRPLSQGCVFAGLGALAGSSRYHDSQHNQSTTLVGSAIGWSSSLGRATILCDGTNSNYVDLNDVANNGSGFTACLWVKPASLGSTRYAMASVTTMRYLFRQDSSGVMQWWVGTFAAGVAGPSMTVGKWQHLCGTLDAAGTTGQFYVDGVYQGQITTTFSGSTTSTRLGAASGGTVPWDGQLADYLHYNRVLTPAEIQTLANPADPMINGWVQPINRETYFLPQESTPQPTKTLIPYHATKKYSQRPHNFRLAPDHVLSQGCVLAGLGAVSGSSRYQDSSVYGNHGTLTAGASLPAPTWSQGLGRRVCDFQPSDAAVGPHILLGQSVPVASASGSTATICHWSYLNNNTRYTTYWGGTPNDTRFLNNNTGSNAYLYDDGGYAEGFTSARLPGKWVHHAMTFNGTSCALYINGSINKFFTEAYDFAWTVFGVSGLKAYSWDGQLADCMIYNRVLAPAEIQTLANPADPMLDGWVQPINRETYFLPIGEAPQPTELITDIFESAIIS